MCSRKCAEPLLSLVSNRLPAFKYNPTVQVPAPVSSEAILSPFSKLVTLISGLATLVLLALATAGWFDCSRRAKT